MNDDSDWLLAWQREQCLEQTASTDDIGIFFAVTRVVSLATQKYLDYMNGDIVMQPDWDVALLNRTESFCQDRSMLPCF